MISHSMFPQIFPHSQMQTTETMVGPTHPGWTYSSIGPKPLDGTKERQSDGKPLPQTARGFLWISERTIRSLFVVGIMFFVYGQLQAINQLDKPFSNTIGLERRTSSNATAALTEIESMEFTPLPDISSGCDGYERDIDEIQIHVLGWRRAESLGILLEQLRDADYSGWDAPVPLHIHLDADYTDDAKAVAENLNWSHGPKNVDIRTEQNGLRGMWLTSLGDAAQQAGANSLMLCFEDDLRVSKRYFQYLQAVVDAYGRNPRCRDSSIMGFSLSPNRIEEMKKPFKRWDAQHAPGLEFDNEDRHISYLSNLPGSWGTAYWSDRWNEFAKFVEMRMRPPHYDMEAEALARPGHYDDLQLSPRELLIPNSRSNVWPKSWKRFMVDFMYARGSVLLYPNLPEEKGFATTLALQGEHVWNESGHAVSNNPRIADLADSSFDSPEFGILPPYKDLRVLNLHLEPTTREALSSEGVRFLQGVHETCSSCDDLLRLWSASEIYLTPPKTSRKGNMNPDICVPDLYMPASALHGRTVSSLESPKYLLMEPQFGANNQIFAIVEGLYWAWVLGRQLVLPPIFVPRVKDFLDTLVEDWPSTEDIFDVMLGDAITSKKAFRSLPPPIKPVGFHDWIETNPSVPRIIRLARDGIWDKSTYILMTELEKRASEGGTGKGVVEVDLTQLFSGSFPENRDLQHYFGGCADEVLAFQGIYFANVKGFDKYSAMIDAMSLTRDAESVFDKVKSDLQNVLGGDDYVCLHVRYGDFGPMCNAAEKGTSGIKFYDKLAQDGFSCGVTPEQVRHFLQTQGLPALVMSDGGALLAASLADLPVSSVSSEWVKRAVAKEAPTMRPAQLELLSTLLEQELCSQGKVTILNRFSTFSKRVQYLRKKHGETIFWRNDESS